MAIGAPHGSGYPPRNERLARGGCVIVSLFSGGASRGRFGRAVVRQRKRHRLGKGALRQVSTPAVCSLRLTFCFIRRHLVLGKGPGVVRLDGSRPCATRCRISLSDRSYGILNTVSVHVFRSKRVPTTYRILISSCIRCYLHLFPKDGAPSAENVNPVRKD